MLTNTEKKILGAMVDMGNLRGQERIDAGSNDEKAREVIAVFRESMLAFLPALIGNLESKRVEIEADIKQSSDLLSLLEQTPCVNS